MARKKNATLGFIDLRVRIYADGDGDVFTEIAQASRPEILTPDLEQITNHGFYENTLNDELFTELETALAKRPNRS